MQNKRPFVLQLGLIAALCLMLGGFLSAISQPTSASALLDEEDISFQDVLPYSSGAARLDIVAQQLSVKTANAIITYFNQKEELFERLKLSSITNQDNLTQAYEDRKQSKVRMDASYERIKALFQEGDDIFDATTAKMTEQDRAKAEELWNGRKSMLAARVRKFYGLETKFLEAYEKALLFLFDRAGTYFIVQNKLVFNGVGDYDYFTGLLDGMKMMSVRQREILKELKVNAIE